ncbi:pyridoxamine 5'-phosphate oxidase family protein [Paracoccus sp. S1E-3]|uniref:pyridoxamine 5'-phosphate oxidase family protein n=1 Tax=Paracoccus sp. S1E-3 TaxID=2756130 RepID=UPI0015EF8681|nr:pyridoxamine 5'-phosphate oxidase family protein [Paracoccus sp. S1E-3]MBA4491613.1 pyridoxamine 5'-phosphate oxidase family protein [Paracoccus sp. S1E-3]
MTRKDVAAVMKGIDLCFMATLSAEGGISSRPMSNNGQVEWDGSNWFFSYGDTRKVRELDANPATTLDFQTEDTWISLRGKAQLHQDDIALFEEHWASDLDRWFPEGIDTPGLTLIEVVAEFAEVNGRAGEGTVDLRG